MTEGNGTPFNMPVVPAGMGGGYGAEGFGGAWWIIIILALMGWGNGFGGYGGGNGNGFLGADVQRGFDQSALVNGQQNILTALNNNQMASMNQNFTMQSAFQNCCCENRLGTADLKYTVANEGAATRISIAEGIQSIKDQMCQDKIDAKNEQIAMLRQELQMAQLAASQGAQTAALMAHNEAQTTALEQYLAPVPRPAYVVQNPNCCANNQWGCGCGNV
jgi:hypothetical protein